jgi:hypothetical protein
MDKINLQVIRVSFGRVVYSHKTHEKDAEISSCHATAVKWANIILTTLTSGTLISTIITNQLILAYISTLLSAITLAFIIFQLSFNPEEKAEKHRQLAKELWYVREKYVNLMADIISERISEDTIIIRRNEIIEELKLIYKFAPITSSKAYKKAQEALKINEELTFSDDEIDQFLPNELKSK